jgi:hypothetical protein
MLARGRFIFAFLLALLFTLVIHMRVSADSITDVGIFWHHFCGCAPHPDDVRVLFSFPITSALIGILLGINSAFGNTSLGRIPGVNADARFLLTRPIPRATALFAPLAVATAALFLIPLLTTFLLLGWLSLVHAPSLGHLLAILQQLPAVHALGPHPALPAILLAIDYPRRLLASVALGLCAYTVLASQRWLSLSSNPSLRRLGAFAIIVLWVPMLTLLSRSVSTYILMLPSHKFPLNWAPSPLSISLHFAFAAAIVLGCWRMLRTAEL